MLQPHLIYEIATFFLFNKLLLIQKFKSYLYYQTL